MHIRSPQVLLWYRLVTRPDNTTQIVMQLPDDIDPSVFFPLDETASIADLIPSTEGRLLATQDEAAARPSTGPAPADIGGTDPARTQTGELLLSPELPPLPVEFALLAVCVCSFYCLRLALVFLQHT
jgi:hypothetical protein